MNLLDIIALAKQGYKPGDIKELIELANVEQEPKQEPEHVEEPKQEPKPDQPTDENVSRETSTEDIKAELEKMKAELEKAKSDLKAAQIANTKKGVEPEPDTTKENIDDWIRSFM